MHQHSFSFPIKNNYSEGYKHLDKIKDREDRYIGDQYFCTLNTPIFSIFDGIVDKVIPWNGNWGYGYHIFVKHYLKSDICSFIEERWGIKSDILYSHYAHLNKSEVEEGKKVKTGDLIGKSGNTGDNIYTLQVDIRKTVIRGYDDNPSFMSVNWVKNNYISPTELIDMLNSPEPINKTNYLYSLFHGRRVF